MHASFPPPLLAQINLFQSDTLVFCQVLLIFSFRSGFLEDLLGLAVFEFSFLYI